MSFVTEHLKDLEAFARMSKQVGDRADYVQGGGGNTSVKTEDGMMAIKASGFRLSDITPENAYALIDYRELAAFYNESDPAALEDVEKAGSEKAKSLIRTLPELPALRPSVEAGFHSILDRFVLHSHSVYCNLAACAAECDEILAAAFADAPYSYAVVPYTDPGAKLTFIIRDAVRETQEKTGKRPAVIVMKNHGLIAHSDDADEALKLHEDANQRIAAYFGVSMSEFPQPRVKAEGENLVSATAYLQERFSTGRYTAEQLLDNPLYPDQMVFFKGTLLPSGEALRDNSCKLDPGTGLVTYRMKESQAQVLEETLCAVVFIHELLEKKGLHIQYMGQDARSFIDNWESEKYRKSLSQK